MGGRVRYVFTRLCQDLRGLTLFETDPFGTRRCASSLPYDISQTILGLDTERLQLQSYYKYTVHK